MTEPNPSAISEPGRPARAAWVTFGCRVNQYDTQLGRERLQACGVPSVSIDLPGDDQELDPDLLPSREIDLVVVNTCTVTARAAARGRQSLRTLRRRFPHARIVATGCHARTMPAELDAMAEVDEVVADAARDPLAGLPAATAPEGIAAFAGRQRPYVKVQEGCEEHCTYCIVPTSRGSLRSRPAPAIVDEVRRLVAAGHREVVIAGIHVGAYARDLAGADARLGLAGLLQRIHQEVPDLERLRLSSIEPFEITAGLLDSLSRLERFAPHLHVPLQHADDRVLRSMNRRYTFSQFRRLADRIRESLDDPGLTTDVITGFPTEDDPAHAVLVAGLETIGFDRVHVFPFSARDGTPAARLASRHRVDGPARERRRMEVLTAAGRVALDAHRRRIGSLERVLLETHAGDGHKEGYSGRFHRVRAPATAGARGRLVPVVIRAVAPPARHGEPPLALGEPA